jgi:LemA protein
MTSMMVIGIAAGAALLIWLAATFNRFIRGRNQMREAWSGIDVQLKRRHDLAPRLVECVKGYRDYERGILENVTTARSRAVQAQGVEQTGQAETALAQNLRSLIVLAEAYPGLKADQSFQQLSTTLIELEDQLQYARRYYNGAVRDFNTLAESFPSVIVARLFGFKTQPFFSIESAVERQAPGVNL